LFDLRYFHLRTIEAIGALREELVVKYFAAGDHCPLSGDETIAANRYLEKITENVDRDFAASMAQWHKTWRRAEKAVDRRGR
jgi:hypothetical protein